MSERPIAGGEMPEGWRPDKWLAFNMLATGSTYAEAAAKVDRSVSTIASWLRGWRKEWGHDVVETERYRGARTMQQHPDAPKWRLAGAMSHKKVHEENRDEIAAAMGVAGHKMREAALAGVEKLLADEDRLAELSPKDILDLARAADVLSGRADKLAGIASADTTARISVGASMGGGPAPDAGVDLSALERAANGGGKTDVFAAVEVVWQRFGREVIEVGEHVDGDD